MKMLESGLKLAYSGKPALICESIEFDALGYEVLDGFGEVNQTWDLRHVDH
jgi:hypothetical protein